MCLKVPQSVDDDDAVNDDDSCAATDTGRADFHIHMHLDQVAKILFIKFTLKVFILTPHF